MKDDAIVRPFLNHAQNTKLLLTLALHILYSGNTFEKFKALKVLILRVVVRH